MSNEQQTGYMGNLSILLRAPEALKNWKAFAILAATFLSVGVLMKFGIYLFGAFETRYVGTVLGGIIFLLAALAGASGVSGAGILLMDQARNIELRSLIDAYIAGAMSVLKVTLIFLLDIVALVVFTLVFLLVLLICKIPGIGPVLYTAAFPLLLLVSGALFAALLFVIVPMTMPAIWEDNSIKSIFARRWALVENRLVQIVIGLLALLFMVGLVAVVVNTILFSGFFFTSGLSASVLNIHADLNSIIGGISGTGMSGYGMSDGGMSGGGTGYITAATIGGGLLFLVAMSIPALVYTLGINLIYLGSMEGLDIAAAEQRVGQAMNEAKRRAEEAKARAAEAAQRARNTAETQRAKMAGAHAASAQPVLVSHAHTCPKCGSTVSDDDVFCGGCGHRLG